MKLVSFFVAVKICSSSDALNSESNPFFKQCLYTENSRNTCDKHIEVAGIGIFECCKTVKLCHKLVGINAALEVNCNFKSVNTCFVTNIGNFLDFTLLYKVDYLSMITSQVVVAGIERISMQFADLS